MTEMMDFFKETGRAGGKERAAKMTKKERSDSARKAAQARWKKAAKMKRAK
jgi:hypothetical protein